MGNVSSKSNEEEEEVSPRSLNTLKVSEVADYFSNVLGTGYSSYAKNILENNVDGKFVVSMFKDPDEEIKECLKDLGITNKAHQKFLITRLRDLQEEAPPVSSTAKPFINITTSSNDFTKVDENLSTSAQLSTALESAAAPPPHRVFISLRFGECAKEAEVLKAALEDRGISTFLCAVNPGGDIAREIVQALHSCELAIIMGTKTYGRDTKAGFSTYEELRYVYEEEKPFFLIKMCEKFEEPMTRFRLGKSISWIEWTPGNSIPSDLMSKIEQRLASLSPQAIFAVEEKDPLEVEFPTKMAYKYWYGEGIAEDKGKAEKLWRAEANKGDQEAYYALVYRDLEGKGNEKLKRDCFEWSVTEANRGNIYLMHAVGWCYENGAGVAQDKRKAVDWYTLAAELGNLTAMTNLGVCYKYGDGIPQDKVKAAEWFSKAAELGNTGAMTNLSLCYKNGEGIPQDKAKAVDLCRKAAELGNASAMTYLGLCYLNGDGVLQDKEKAVKCYMKAANFGNAQAMTYLGVCYMNGDGITLDKLKAFEWFTIAADLGNVRAMTNLGVFYENGDGIEQDKVKAVQLYTKAAQLGDVAAMFNLGVCYYYGNGVEKDRSLVRHWWTLAANKGHPRAQTNLRTFF